MEKEILTILLSNKIIISQNKISKIIPRDDNKSYPEDKDLKGVGVIINKLHQRKEGDQGSTRI